MRKHNARKAIDTLTRAMVCLGCLLAGSAWGLDFGFGNVATDLDLSASSLTDTVMTVTSTLASITNTATIGAGQELRITGNVTVGANAVNSYSLLKMAGGGSFVITNASTIQIGGATGNNNRNAGVLDMSELSTFSALLESSSTLQVGNDVTGSNYAPNIPPTLVLATNSIIKLGSISVGFAAEDITSLLKLGSGENILNVNTITLGKNRAAGEMSFNTSTGNVKIRGYAGTDSDRANLLLGVTGSGVSTTCTMDFRNHAVDAMFDGMIIGKRDGGSSKKQVNKGVFYFNQGTLNANTILLGHLNSVQNTGAENYGTTGNMTLNGGTTVVNRGMVVARNSTTVSNLYYVGTGLFTVSGTADVTVSNTVSSAAITIAEIDSPFDAVTAIGTVAVSGGKLKLVGDLVHGADSISGAHGSATVNLTGGALLMPDHAIVNIDNFTMKNAVLAVNSYSGCPTLNNQGTGVLAPGGIGAVGSTTVSTNYTQAATATLDIDIASSSSYDTLVVTGEVTLAGKINLRAPAMTSGQFDIVTSEEGIIDTSVLVGDADKFSKMLVNDGKTLRLLRVLGTVILVQ